MGHTESTSFSCSLAVLVLRYFHFTCTLYFNHIVIQSQTLINLIWHSFHFSDQDLKDRISDQFIKYEKKD